MKKLVKELCEKCKDAIEQAAYDKYYNGEDLEGTCYALVKLDKGVEIEVDWVDDTHEVIIYHATDCDLRNIEAAISAYLNAYADEPNAWQDAYDHDDWRDVDPGCDPAFPHYGDFERWAYGR